MKVVKLILIVFLISIISFAIPCYIHNNMMYLDKYYTLADGAETKRTNRLFWFNC